jgi:hypothetical protein
MCFSAGASFTAAGFLSIISLLSIKQVRTKKMMPIALTPLFFGIQQAAEGFVWITLNNGDTTSMLHLTSMYVFLFFALVFWPTWIPALLYWLEDVYKRKQLLYKLMWCGIFTSLLFLWCWILKTNGAVIIQHHIDYLVDNYPFNCSNPIYCRIGSYMLTFLYGLVTITPFFISSIPYMKVLGITAGIGAVIAYIFYLMAFASVWCFFTAVCSVLIYFIVWNYKKIKL